MLTTLLRRRTTSESFPITENRVCMMRFLSLAVLLVISLSGELIVVVFVRLRSILTASGRRRDGSNAANLPQAMFLRFTSDVKHATHLWRGASSRNYCNCMQVAREDGTPQTFDCVCRRDCLFTVVAVRPRHVRWMVRWCDVSVVVGKL